MKRDRVKLMCAAGVFSSILFLLVGIAADKLNLKKYL